jgi:hypothetical protein
LPQSRLQPQLQLCQPILAETKAATAEAKKTAIVMTGAGMSAARSLGAVVLKLRVRSSPMTVVPLLESAYEAIDVATTVMIAAMIDAIVVSS